MSTNYFLSFDLGASSGRAIAGKLDGEKLTLTEVHRFKNRMISIHGSYYWDVFSLFEELMTGLRKCIEEWEIHPQSIGVDTWGVDYLFLNSKGRIAGLPFAYRDGRTNGMMERFFRKMDRAETYRLSGIQFMQFNSLFQLFTSVVNRDPELLTADKLLFMPDALNYLFTGIKRNEYTIASTSQLLKPGEVAWEPGLIDAAGVESRIFCDLVPPGTILGPLLPDIRRETGCGDIPCVAVAGHDTASAVVSVPAEGERWAFLSSGTWSLLGIESPHPLVSDKSLKMNFTNEGGVEGTTRFLKNIMGMWLIQECKRLWDNESVLSWQDIVDMSLASQPFKCFIDPDDPAFLNPTNMPEAIKAYCRKSNQQEPETIGEIARCIYESLAFKYKFTLNQIEEITGEQIEKLHIIGGGSNNEILNQFTANATNIPVLAGPVEATAIGNLLMQAKALDVVKNLQEIRTIVRNSFEVRAVLPNPDPAWENAWQMFKTLTNNNPDE